MKTEQDAFDLVIQARTGSLVEANPNYLVALRQHVQGWLDRIDEEIAKDLLSQNMEKA